jgi:hypothetical protein
LILCLPIATASHAAVLGTTEAGWTLQEGGLRLGCGGSERYGLWLLKNSILLKITEIWGIENVYPNGESRL